MNFWNKSFKALLMSLLMLFGLILAACGDNTVTNTAASTTVAARSTTAAPTTVASTTVAATTAASTTALLTTAIATTTLATTFAATPAVAPTVAPPATKLKVVATTTQIGDFVKNVGGNRIDLTTILKPNVDPHDYEPVPMIVRLWLLHKLSFLMAWGWMIGSIS